MTRKFLHIFLVILASLARLLVWISCPVYSHRMADLCVTTLWVIKLEEHKCIASHALHTGQNNKKWQGISSTFLSFPCISCMLVGVNALSFCAHHCAGLHAISTCVVKSTNWVDQLGCFDNFVWAGLTTLRYWLVNELWKCVVGRPRFGLPGAMEHGLALWLLSHILHSLPPQYESRLLCNYERT